VLDMTIVHSALNPNPTIANVRLFTSGTADALVDNFTLSVQVPEPASTALIGAAIPLLMRRRRD
jgi:hypothetical protein